MTTSSLASSSAAATDEAVAWTDLTPQPQRVPDVSVIFPTYKRPELARKLVESLARQTLTSERYEILAVDDGSPEPALEHLHDLRPGCHTAVGRKANGGPARARNAAIARARGRYLLILNDDAVPAPDLIERHLEAQATHDVPVATLGTFDYSEAARRSPFVRYLERQGLTFGYKDLKPERLTDFWSFWTCNICIEKELVDSVGGFDEDLPDALMEDIELGWRLQRDRGVHVRFVPEAHCIHDHKLTVVDYARRQRMLGTNCYRLFKKFGNVSLLSLGVRGGHLSLSWLGPFDRRFFMAMEATAATMSKAGRRSYELLRRWEQIEDPAAGDHFTDEQLDKLEASVTRWCFLEAVAEAGLTDLET